MLENRPIFIIADDPFVQAGLARLLEQDTDCIILGQGPTPYAGSSLTSTASLDHLDYHLGHGTRPDLIIWDLGWEPSPEIFEQMADWAGGEGNCPVMVLATHVDDAAQAWAVGAQGILLRDSALTKLVSALEALNQGLVLLDPTFTEVLFSPKLSSLASSSETLTPREAEVLQFLAQGLTNKAIAHRLGISDHTVKFHVHALMTKLNAQSRTEAVVSATRLGLISL